MPAEHEPLLRPAQIAAGEALTDRTIRADGGRRVGGAFKTDLTVTFEVGDLVGGATRITWVSARPVPRGTGRDATGRLNAGGVFVAEEVLAKHDETYMRCSKSPTRSRRRTPVVKR